MKLGWKERQLLEAVSAGDEFLGLLTSGGSGYLAHKQARRHAHNRATRRERYEAKKRLERLAKKNLITLDATGETWRATVLPQGDLVLRKQALLASAATPPDTWDGQWRMVMFDIPQEHYQYRHALRRLLCRCGYLQVQQSVYVYPYDIPGLVEYLRASDVYGAHVHVFCGIYQGDEDRLRKEFGLK